MDYNTYLEHYGVLGMRWGVRKKEPPRQWTKEPEGNSLKNQIALLNAKDALKRARGSEARKKAQIEVDRLIAKRDANIKEYLQFEKDMEKKNGKWKAEMIKFRDDGKAYYVNRKGENIPAWQANGLMNASMRRGAVRGMMFYNTLIAAGVGLLAYSVLSDYEITKKF